MAAVTNTYVGGASKTP